MTKTNYSIIRDRRFWFLSFEKFHDFDMTGINSINPVRFSTGKMKSTIILNYGLMLGETE